MSMFTTIHSTPFNSNNMTVQTITTGWNKGWLNKFKKYQETSSFKDEKLYPARIIGGGGSVLETITIHGDPSQEFAETSVLIANIAGKYKGILKGQENLPVAGDWVLGTLDDSESLLLIHHILPRESLIMRVAPGGRDELQALAANIDYTFIVTSLDEDFSARRVERYLILLHDSGSKPVILLNKCDLADQDEINRYRAELTEAAPGIPIHTISASEGINMDQLRVYMRSGVTLCMLGSSGTGKSTIINHISGMNSQKTQQVREVDSKGRHTTTSRSLIFLPDGTIFIDTPGLREVQVMPSGEGLAQTFPKIDLLSRQCKFRDCQHEGEPGCAVQEAIDNGEISSDRLAGWKKIKCEMEGMVRRNREKPVSKDLRNAGGRKPGRRKKKK